MKKRLFIGTLIENIDISEIKTEIERLQIEGKWVEPWNLHFTYKFLGDVEESKIPLIETAIKASLKNTKKIEGEIVGVGTFPESKRAKVVWLGLKAEGIEEIKEKIDRALLSLSFQKDDREFKPHITILRIKKLRHRVKFSNYIRLMKERKFKNFTIDKVSLIESKLTREGPIYKKLLTVELK